MTPEEHIRRLMDAMENIGNHAKGDPAVFSAISSIELGIYELRKAFEDQKLMEKT
jgi:hypothetical protein